MSNNRLTIDVYGAGELVPGFEVFDAVSQGANISAAIRQLNDDLGSANEIFNARNEVLMGIS